MELTSSTIEPKKNSGLIKMIILIAAGVLVLGSVSSVGAAYYQSNKLIKEGDSFKNNGEYSAAASKYDQAIKKWKMNESKVSTKVDETKTLISEQEKYDLGEIAYQRQDWQNCSDELKKVSPVHKNYSSALSHSQICQQKMQEEVDLAAKTKADLDAKTATDAQIAADAKAKADTAAAKKVAEAKAKAAEDAIIPTPIDIVITALDSDNNNKVMGIYEAPAGTPGAVYNGYYEFGIPLNKFKLTYPSVSGAVSARGILEEGASTITDLGDLNLQFNDAKIGLNVIRVEVLNSKGQIIATGKTRIVRYP